MAEGKVKCKQCGTLVPQKRYCGACGFEMMVMKFCMDCGKEKCVCKSDETKTVSSFSQFQAAKSKQRSELIERSKKKHKVSSTSKKSKEESSIKEVIIRVGLMVLEQGVLKKQRGGWAKISVAKTASSETVLKLALEKHSSLDQYFYASEEYVLLYPDEKVVDKIPSSDEVFTVQKYKEFLKEPYDRVALYLCQEIDFINSCDEPKKKEDKCSDTESDEDPKKKKIAIDIVPKKIVTKNIEVKNDYVIINAEAETDTTTKSYPCPTCRRLFSLMDIETHADECASQKSQENATIVIEDDAITMNENNDSELYRVWKQNKDQQQQRVNSNPTDLNQVRAAIAIALQNIEIKTTDERVNLIVFRGTCFDDFHKYFKKPWNSRKAVKLFVKFAGEEGKDEGGGVSREFYTEALKDIKDSYFCGLENAMEPLSSAHSVADGTVTSIGHLFAASICNQGPAPNFLAPWIYDYIINGVGEVFKTLPELNCSSQMGALYTKVYQAETLESLRDAVVCDDGFEVFQLIGYRALPSSITLEDKEDLLRTILLKKIEPYITFLEGLMQGLEVYGLLRPMRANPEIFKLMFCHSETLLWTCEMFIENLKADFAEDGTNIKKSQLSCYRIFLEMCDLSFNQKNPPFKFASLIQYVTGTDSIPPCGIPQLSLRFKPPCPKSNNGNACRCLPEASTCTSTLILPLHFRSVEEMFKSFGDAFEHVKKHGFGRS